MNRLAKLFLVNPAERGLAAYFGAVFFLVGVAIAVLRGSADALFFKRYGIQYLPFAYAGVGVLLALVSVTYAAFVDRAAAERSLRVMLIAQMLAIAGLWALIRYSSIQAVYPAYYVFYVIVSELLYMHIMLYLSHNLEMDQMKRLSPLALAGYTLGNVAGGLTVAVAAPLFGVPNLLWIALAASAAVLVMAELRHARIGVSPYFQPGRRRPDALRASLHQVTEGLRYAQRSEMLRMAFASLFFMVMAFYVLSYTVNRIYAAAFPGEEALGTFLGVVVAVTSLLAVLAQLFVSSRLLERFGVRRVNLFFPLACLASYALLVVSFTVPAALAGSFVRDTIKPAVRDPVLNVFYEVLPDSIRGRARALSLAFVLPLAMLAAAGFLLLAQHYDQPRLFPLLGAAAAGAYLFFNLRMNRAYKTTLLETLRQKLFVPAEKFVAGMVSAEPAILDELAERVRQGCGVTAVESARTLLNCDAGAGLRAIRARLRDAPEETKSGLLEMLARHPEAAVHAAIRSVLPDLTEPRLRAAALRNLSAVPCVNALQEAVVVALSSQYPELVAAGILGIFRVGPEARKVAARDRLRQMLEGGDPAAIYAGLNVAGDLGVPDVDDLLAALTRHDDAALAKTALAATARRRTVTNEKLIEAVRARSGDGNPVLRQAAIGATAGLPDAVRKEICLAALDDGHPRVRETALDVLTEHATDFERVMVEYLVAGSGTPRAREACLAKLANTRSPRSVLTGLARNEAENAMRYAAVLRAIGAREALLSIVIEERLHAAVDRCLAALEPMEGRAATGVIRAGLRTGESRNRAAACEALRLLKHKDIAAMLLVIIERPREARLPGEPERDSNEWRKWLAGHPDPWLSECARTRQG